MKTTNSLKLDFYELLKTFPEKGTEKFICYKLASFLSLIVTKKCNLKCPYCYDRSRVNFTSDNNKELDISDFIKILKDARAIGMRGVRITGGELFLKEGICDLLKACQGMYVVLATNGTLLDKWLDKLKKLNIDYHFHISLDGWNSHAKYKKGSCHAHLLLNKLEEVKEKIPSAELSINTVINKDNIYELNNLYDQIKDSRIDFWTISLPVLVTELRQNYYDFPDFEVIVLKIKDLLVKYFADNKPFQLSCNYLYKGELANKHEGIFKKTIEGHPCLPVCNAARSLTIDAFGNIIDCLYLPPEKLINLRNYKQGSLIKLAKDCLTNSFYKLRIKDKKACSKCRYIALCGGGCPYNSQIIHKKTNRPDYIACTMLTLAEKYIFPILPKHERKKLDKFINYKGKKPTRLFRNFSDIMAKIYDLKKCQLGTS